MIKSILVPATGQDSDLAVFQTALRAARQCGARLDFLHVRVDPVGVAASFAAMDGGAGMLASGWIDQLAAEAEQRAKRARQICDKFCADGRIALDGTAGAGPVVGTWREEIGDEPALLAERARPVDLAVVGRPAEANGAGMATLETVLFDGGRPVLIPGKSPLAEPVRRVAVAWKPTREAARAVTASMPFIERAASVTVLTVAENDDPQAIAESAESIARTLRLHASEVTIRVEPAQADGGPEALLAAAAGCADLLVMGAYGHNRFREMVFGGFTESALRHADIPILAAH